MDRASSIKDRMETLKALHENGIYTVVFMSPIFPYITDFKKIIEKTRDYVDEYWFENLNLRGDYKYKILKYIEDKYPNIYKEYKNIYLNNDNRYWEYLTKEIDIYCNKHNIKYKNYFHHDEIRKNI